MDDLSARAAENGPARRAAAAAAVAADSTGQLRRLSSLLAGSALSTNVNADRVIAFDEA